MRNAFARHMALVFGACVGRWRGRVRTGRRGDNPEWGCCPSQRHEDAVALHAIPGAVSLSV